jgi:hypothetical protein
MQKIQRRPRPLLFALAFACISNSAVAGDEFVRTVREIEPDESQAVILASADGKCMFVGRLTGVEHVPVGFLDKLGDRMWRSDGATPPKDWALTIERKQCSADTIEPVNGTVKLGNLLKPVPTGTWLKVTLQSG